MKIAVTGNPGVGKSTLVAQIADRTALPHGGMITAEIRKCGRRVGFSLRDLATGKEGVLAHRHLSDGPAFGPYRLNLHDLDLIGVAAIERATREAQLVIVDEVGPMELHSPRFIQAVRQALSLAPNLLVTVHRKSNHALAYTIRHRVDRLIRLTRDGRTAAVAEILHWLAGSADSAGISGARRADAQRSQIARDPASRCHRTRRQASTPDIHSAEELLISSEARREPRARPGNPPFS